MFKINQEIKEKIERYYFLYLILKNTKEYSFYFINKIFNYQLEKNRFYKELGYPVNLKNPKSFNEKVFWKKINDRNPLLPYTADKYLVRSYIRELLGEEISKKILIPLFYVTDEPDTIPFEKIPLPFIVKPNHGSGLKIIVENRAYNKKEIIKTCKRWLKTPYGLDKLEWAYQSVKRKIIIEKYLKGKDGNTPTELKFHMFHGKCKLVYVIIDRLNNSSRMYYDEKWNYLAVKKKKRPQGTAISKPEAYEMMLKTAEILSKYFDYVRIDFYSLDKKLFFGELTHYPISGKLMFEPRTFDFELGKHWIINSEYWEIGKNEINIE